MADETSLLHVVHLVVPVVSRYAAVAKGTTAASFVPRNEGMITGCDLIADLDDEAGHGIESDDRLTVLLKDVGDDLWVLPALALYRTESDDSLLQRFRMWRRRQKVSKAYGMIAHAELKGRVHTADADGSGNSWSVMATWR